MVGDTREYLDRSDPPWDSKGEEETPQPNPIFFAGIDLDSSYTLTVV
jgi:hypothetical protein